MSAERRGWLVFFGIIHFAIALLALLLFFGTAVAQPPNVGQSLLFDGIAAFYFLAVGVGSIRARRWARSIALAMSAVWLLCGLVALAALFIVIPHLLVIVPPSQEHAFVLGATMTVLIALILVPLTFVLFYRAPSVRATVEAEDTKPRWTDRTPLPVLALSITFGFGALMLIVNINAKAYFLFGFVMTGATASIAIVALALLFAIVAVQLYRLRESAWWTVLLLHVLAGVGTLVSFSRGADVNELYQRSGTLTPQIRAMHLEQLARDPKLWAVIAIGWIAYFAFLIWLRRFYALPQPSVDVLRVDRDFAS